MTSPLRTNNNQQRSTAPTQRVFPSYRVPSTFQPAPSGAGPSDHSSAPTQRVFPSYQVPSTFQPAPSGTGNNRDQQTGYSQRVSYESDAQSFRLSQSTTSEIPELANRSQQGGSSGNPTGMQPQTGASLDYQAMGLPLASSSRSRSSRSTQSASQFPYVRRRGKNRWAAEYRAPNSSKKIWVGTFDSELEAYEKALEDRARRGIGL